MCGTYTFFVKLYSLHLIQHIVKKGLPSFKRHNGGLVGLSPGKIFASNIYVACLEILEIFRFRYLL